MRLRVELTRRVCQLYWDIKWLAGSKKPEAKLTPSELEIVSVSPEFSLSVGTCKFCLAGNENLCPDFKAAGRYANGGYAQYMKVAEGFAYHIPHFFNDSEAVPLLCAGAIGYQSMRLSGLKD